MAVAHEAVALEEVVVPLRQGDDFGAEPEADLEADAPPPVSLAQTALAGFLATAAAAWMVGGMFSGWQPRATGLGAAALGSAFGYLTYRSRRPWLQYLLPVAAVVAGAVLLAPDAHAGTSNLFGLVVDAVRSGGILQPPVDFAPGWKFILTALFMILAAGSIGVAMASGRPRLTPIVPVPLALGAALVQPPGAALLSSAVTIVGLIAAFAVAYGAALRSGMGDSANPGAGFELRRLARTGGMVAGLVIAVIVLNQAGFLFPSPDQNRVVPPQRPQVPPPGQDVPLFRVTTNAQTPYRLGVIDVYDVKSGAWLLPGQDNHRLRRLSTPATLPGPKLAGQDLTATFVVKQATGHLLPLIGGTVKVAGLPGQQFDFDPRQETIRLAGRPVFTGLTYTVEAPLPTGGSELRSAAPASKSIRDEFLAAPPVPLEVQALLDKAPVTNNFDRLQYMRQQLYDKVVAAGSGKPVDVSAKRAVQVLGGQDASPYEITATEALLARWAGIPARIGYGYYGGDKQSDGSIEIRPRNGATWLEVNFGQYGWIPVVGTPPHAKPSTSTEQKNQNSAIHPVDDLALIVYLPVRLHTILPLYVILRYWLSVALPFVAAFIAVAVFYPGGVKAVRGSRRRRWALRQGPRERVAVAYAEFRDAARDLAIGDPTATPLEFVDYIDPDREHRELAWLVTRALYGDLRHNLAQEQVTVAEELSRSVTRRLRRAQSFTTRALAFAARNSLREPYSAEIPNLWRSRARGRRLGLRFSPAAVAAALIAGLVLSACGSSAVRPPRPLPSRLVPDQLGALSFVEEPKAEASFVKAKADSDIVVSDGRVFTVHQGDITEGSIQVSRFKPGYSSADADIVDAIKQAVGKFDTFKGTRVRAWVSIASDQRIYLWFPPKSDSMALLILRNAFTATNSDAVARTLINYQAGVDPASTLSLGPDQEDAGSGPPVILQQPTFSASGG